MIVVRRLLPIVLLAALYPAQCAQEGPAPHNSTETITVNPLPLPRHAAIAHAGADIQVSGAWELTSPHSDFTGLSGLAMGREARLIAVTDQGARLSFTPPPAPALPSFERVSRSPAPKYLRDAEAVAFDPSGREWIAFEGVDRLAWRDAPSNAWQIVTTPDTAEWSSNGGVETLTFLKDGRMLLLEERPLARGAGSRALLYSADVKDDAPLAFRFIPPPGYSPTDAATLPDGRVLILLRAVRAVPPGFFAKIVLANPARIAPGREWHGQEIARIAAPYPIDNMEGLAVNPRGDGMFDLWLVSDDNGLLLQRTVLMKLRYRPPSIDGAGTT